VGRHSRPEDLDDDVEREILLAHRARPVPGVLTDPLTVVEPSPGPEVAVLAAVPETEPAAPTAPPAQPPRPRPRPSPRRAIQGSALDLKLIRAHPDVRNRCLAALLVPFVIYVVILLLAGSMDRFVIYVFAPIIIASVLFGATLDHAHKHHPEG
jgi:hypothetical protein